MAKNKKSSTGPLFKASFTGNLENGGGFKKLFYDIRKINNFVDKELEKIKKEKTMDAENKVIYNKLSKMRLGGSDYLVFICLLGHLDYNNKITLKQKDIADLCNMSKSQVSRSIKKLKEVEVLENQKDLMIHIDLLYRGWADVHREEKEKKIMQSSPFNKIGRQDAWADINESVKKQEREKAKEQLTEQ